MYHITKKQDTCDATNTAPPEVLHLLQLTKREILPRLLADKKHVVSHNEFSRLVLEGLKTLGLYHRQAQQASVQVCVLRLASSHSPFPIPHPITSRKHYPYGNLTNPAPSDASAHRPTLLSTNGYMRYAFCSPPLKYYTVMLYKESYVLQHR